MIVPITREVKVLLLKALKRGYFNDVEVVKLNTAICFSNNLMTIRRMIEIIDECSQMNEKIRQGNEGEACNVTNL